MLKKGGDNGLLIILVHKVGFTAFNQSLSYPLDP